MSEDTLRRFFAQALGDQARGDFGGAILAWKRVLALDPAQVDAWCNLGGCLRELHRTEEALAATRRAVELDPTNLAARCNLGILALDQGRMGEALERFQTALAEDPHCFPAQFHLGGVLGALGRWEEGREAARAAVALDPACAAAHSNLAWHHMRLAEFPEAESAVAKALDLDPDLPHARWNRFYIRFLQGRWQEAWPDFPFRLELLQMRKDPRRVLGPAWGGEPLAGRTLLLWAEQGFGDTLQFLRFVPPLRALGGRVVLRVQPALLPLLKNWPGADEVIGEVDPLPPFQVQAPLLEVAALFGVGPEDLGRDEPYLNLPQDYLPPAQLCAAMEGSATSVRIGLCWTGNPTHLDQARRSIPPEAFAPLAALPGVQWFSFQKFQTGAETGPLPSVLEARDLALLLSSFTDTAWALGRIHLLITADVGVAHLAGALGTPVLLLLPYSPDWRWGQTGETTPWYPTFRIYRQPQHGDWASVIQALLRDLLGT